MYILMGIEGRNSVLLAIGPYLRPFSKQAGSNSNAFDLFLECAQFKSWMEY
jgi:hypothetical protein